MAGKFLVAFDTLVTGLTACALSVTYGDTSPKGRGLGKEVKFAWTAKGSPFGRAGALAPERASTLKIKASATKTLFF